MGITTLQTCKAVMDSCPFFSVVDLSIHGTTYLFGGNNLSLGGLCQSLGFNTLNNIIGFLQVDSSDKSEESTTHLHRMSGVVHRAALILFLFSHTSLTRYAAIYNSCVGVTHVVLGCLRKVFPSEEFPSEDQKEKDRTYVRDELHTGFEYLCIVVYDLAVGYFMETRLGLFAALFFGVWPVTMMSLHQRVLKTRVLTKNSKNNPRESGDLTDTIENKRLWTCFIRSVVTRFVEKAVPSSSPPSEADESIPK